MAAPSRINNDTPSEGIDGGRRHLKTRYVLQSLAKRRARLLATFALLVAVFIGVALLQQWLVHWQFYRTTYQELASSAEQIARQIAYRDKWDLKQYRRAPAVTPLSYVIARDGLIVDLGEVVPGIIDRVQIPDESIFHAPKMVTSSVGEPWRLFGKEVEGGYVVVGIPLSEITVDADAKLSVDANVKQIADADARLTRSLNVFGSTLREATALSETTSTKFRGIDAAVDIAVLSSAGELKTAWGGVPLRTDINALPVPSDHVVRLNANGRPYLLYYEPILDLLRNPVGTIIVGKDLSLEQQALRNYDRLNYWIVGVALALAVLVVLALIVREFLSQTKAVSLEEALRVGESRTIEFKSAFQWDFRRKEKNEERRLETLRSIAGFLNAKGGTLFIGVTEDTTPPSVRGLAEDLNIVGGSKDRLQLLLRDLITKRIGSEYSPFVSDSLQNYGDNVCWVVVVDESPVPAFVLWENKRRFYVREGPKTSDLDSESTWRYIKSRWR